MKIHCTKLKYASDKTIKEKLEIWFVKDHSKAIKFRIFNLILKVTTCVLYIVEVLMDPLSIHYSKSSKKSNSNSIIPFISPPSFRENSTSLSPSDFLTQFFTALTAISDPAEEIDWRNIFFVRRHPVVRNLQLVIAIYGLLETLFYFYLCYNRNFLEKIKNAYFYIEIFCTVPWIIEYLSPKAKDIFIPVFLNCWLIKRNLNYIFKDFNNINIKHHNSVIGQHLISLGTLFFCLIFTSVCGFQHLQRANLKESISLFDSLYYIIITFSTVGYGDITPNTWPSKLFMAVMIIVALVVIPTQLEHLASLWFERQNLGASYSSHRAANEKHIVVCSTNLQYDLIIDFLHEFYAHRKNHNIHTILLSSCELDLQLRSLLHTPLWKQRVFYIHGSALRDTDLARAKVNQAKSVFIIASRGIDKDLADQHSILRSWAIKDFAPHTPQFVQLFRPENKINLKFAEYLVCEDEFKYALLANNCLCPGISTLVTLLLHKSKLNPEKECQDDTLEEWQQIYSKLAGNEIHSITAENSKFFQEFIGKTFVQASCQAHKKYNVCLIGIGKHKNRMSMAFSSENVSMMYSRSSIDDLSNTSKNNHFTSQNSLFNRNILLNPGPQYEIENHDVCYYISLVKEENYNWKNLKSAKSFAVEELYQNMVLEGPDLSLRLKAAERANARKESVDRNFNVLEAHAGEFSQEKSISNYECDTTTSVSPRKHYHEIRNSDLIVGRPPYPLYIGCNPTLCKLLRIPNQLCCLELNRECEHKTCVQASDYKWRNKCILVVAEYATNGLFNFILPLRAQVRSVMFLRPIVLLLEHTPTIEFLEAISPFPLVYWLKGSISNLSTLLKAGVMDSETVIVVSPEKYAQIDDDSLTDCSNIVSVQNLYRLFPKIKVVAELTKASNIRFMKFRAKEMVREDGLFVKFNNLDMGYMLRLPFASGNVFSASMIDTLLYQTFGKPYLIELIRLLIGISQTSGSGNLTSIPLTESDMWIKTYGNLYKKLISTSGEIPIGLYRTKINEKRRRPYRISSKLDIQQMILIKMNKLGIDPDKYKSYDEHAEKFSYVLINPPHDYILKAGDIVYLLKPGSNTFPAMPNESEDLSLGQQSSQQRQHDLNSPTNTTIITQKPYQQQQNSEDPQSPKMSIDSPTTHQQQHQKFSLPMSSSHLSIDESWLELNATPAIGDEISEATTANKSKKNSIDFIASKLNLNNLKKIFLPSSGVSLQAAAAAENEDDMIGPLRELEKLTTSGILVSTSGGVDGGGRCGGVVGTGKVRSKSVVSTSIPTSEKLAQMALRKKFFQATRLNNKHQDDISI